jgi:hypothetical protein
MPLRPIFLLVAIFCWNALVISKTLHPLLKQSGSESENAEIPTDEELEAEDFLDFEPIDKASNQTQSDVFIYQQGTINQIWVLTPSFFVAETILQLFPEIYLPPPEVPRIQFLSPSQKV